MLRINTLKNNYSNIKKCSSAFIRSYLSYPDPNEKPKISKLTLHPSINNSDASNEYKVNPLFNLTKPYPTTKKIVPLNLTKPFEPKIFNLNNNLTVTMKDHIGIMSTVSFLVHAGR